MGKSLLTIARRAILNLRIEGTRRRIGLRVIVSMDEARSFLVRFGLPSNPTSFVLRGDDVVDADLSTVDGAPFHREDLRRELYDIQDRRDRALRKKAARKKARR